jgi:glycosyltransferase involved in cell wall biosynthesis
MDYKLPLVSIGMPVFNSQKYINRALDSLLSQSYPNFEIIISDNCSEDQTADICKKYAEKDKRVRLSVNKSNLGINANFKIVYRKASGKYFMWAACDDYWEPEFIKKLVNELESNPGAGVASCAVKREYSDGSLIDLIRFNGRDNPNNLSSFQVAVKLLGPSEQIKQLKYNLFICGLFNYEAINESLTVSENNLSFGERAVLSPIALAYRFRYVDEVLFIKTVHEKPYWERQPEDDFIKKKKRRKYYEHYYRIILWIAKSPTIPLKNKIFIFVILYFIVYRFIHKQKKKFFQRKK